MGPKFYISLLLIYYSRLPFRDTLKHFSYIPQIVRVMRFRWCGL